MYIIDHGEPIFLKLFSKIFPSQDGIIARKPGIDREEVANYQTHGWRHQNQIQENGLLLIRYTNCRITQ